MLGKLIIGCAAAVAFLTLAAAPAAAGVDDFVGQWTPQTPSGEVTRVVVTRSGAGARVRVYTRCQPQDCTSGDVPARAYAPNVNGDLSRDAIALMASYDVSFGGGDQVNARRTFIVHLTSDGARYEMFTDLPVNSGRTNYVETGNLQHVTARRPTAPSATLRRTLTGENCFPVNQANLQLVNAGGNWRIMDGGRQVLYFGANRTAAERSLAIIRQHGFTSQCVIPLPNPVIANPNPTMTYWRRGDTVPEGLGGGEDCMTVNPFYVRAEIRNGSWHVVDYGIEGHPSVLNFGEHGYAAQAVAVIQYYNLWRICFVDRPGPLMQYWLAN